MKRILIIMILFVNLQIVINEGKGVVSSFSNAYAINVSEISSVIDNGELVIGAIHNDKYYCHEVVIVGYYNDPGNIYYYQCMDPYTGKFATISASDFWSGSLFKYSSSNVYKSLNDY